MERYQPAVVDMAHTRKNCMTKIMAIPARSRKGREKNQLSFQHKDHNSCIMLLKLITIRPWMFNKYDVQIQMQQLDNLYYLYSSQDLPQIIRTIALPLDYFLQRKV